MYAVLLLSEKMEKAGNAVKSKQSRFFLFCTNTEYKDNCVELHDLSLKLNRKAYKTHNENEGIKIMLKNISADTTNSLDIFLIFIDNIMYWSKCGCLFWSEFLPKGKKSFVLFIFLQRRNSIFMETEGKSMLAREGWFNVFIIVTAVVYF